MVEPTLLWPFFFGMAGVKRVQILRYVLTKFLHPAGKAMTAWVRKNKHGTYNHMPQRGGLGGPYLETHDLTAQNSSAYRQYLIS